MRRLANISIDKKDIVSFICSHQADGTDCIQDAFIDFLQREHGRQFDIKKIKYGTPQDDFVALYYASGIRYKVLKDGCAYITYADADQFLTSQESELQVIINSAIRDFIETKLRNILTSNNIKAEKTKILDDNPEESQMHSITGISL